MRSAEDKPDITNLLIQKKVDLVLHGHERGREELEDGLSTIRSVVNFGDQAEFGEEEDRGEEYLRLTVEGIGRIRKLYHAGLKEAVKLYAAAMHKWGRPIPENLSHLRDQFEAAVPARQEAASLVAREQADLRAHVS